MIYIDITEEFNEFQEKLKQDWLLSDPINNKPNKWNNRKYFMDQIVFNKQKNTIFYQYYVHLDDPTQVASYGTHTH